MASKNTISINGREYDPITGLPLAPTPTSRPQPSPKSEPSRTISKASSKTSVKATPGTAKKLAPANRGVRAAANVHASEPKRSQTLRRTAVKKPVAPTKVAKRPRPSTTRHMDIARSTSVTKYAAHPQAAVAKSTASATSKVAAAQHSRITSTPATKRPVKTALSRKPIQKIQKPQSLQKASPKKVLAAKDIKDAEIKKALASKKTSKNTVTKQEKKIIKKNVKGSTWKKRTIILTAVAVIVLLGVVSVTHLFPSLSVKVASIQTGVAAAYPKYTPDGYSLKQPIKYGDGKVAIVFKSNSNPTGYTLGQAGSSWDSTALLDNLVKKEAGNNYMTTRERGLTIYTYGTNAAWVNGGILFTIEGDADLSGDQIRKIATSL